MQKELETFAAEKQSEIVRLSSEIKKLKYDNERLATDYNILRSRTVENKLLPVDVSKICRSVEESYSIT